MVVLGVLLGLVVLVAVVWASQPIQAPRKPRRE